MKTKIFALFLGMLCVLTSALAQSETFTGFNGRIKFTSFANNGLYVRGTLDDFLDQTNQYVASDMIDGDVVWDNQGRRYLVHEVVSSNLTQAVVDLDRIGGGTHIPTGVGFVSRETSNGLALIPPVNSTGISTQLASRAMVHNMKALESKVVNPSWLYVSLLNGNNATARVGDPTAPWADPFAAADYVEANNIYPNEIFVLDGTFYYIPAEDSLEVPVDPGYNKWIDNESTMGLLRDNVIFHFSRSVQIRTWVSDAQLTANQHGLFWTDNGGSDVIIDGFLQIIGDSPTDQEYSVLMFDVGGGDLNIELDEIDGGGIHFFKEGFEATSNAKLKLKANVLGFSIVTPSYFGGSVILTANEISGSVGSYTGGYLEINRQTPGGNALYVKGGSGSVTKLNASGGEIVVQANGGVVSINQTDGTLEVTPHGVDFGVVPEVKLTANLDHVELRSILSGQLSYDKLTLNCNPCTLGDSLEIAVINTDSSYVRLMGTVDLQGTNFISLEPHPTTPLTDKCFFFRDLEFLNPPTGIPSLRSQRANFAAIFMNCWSNSDFSTEGVIIGGEPINTY